MAWYHHLGTWILIGAFVAFWIIPDKNLIFIGVCVIVGLIGLAMMRYLPHKEEDEEHPGGKEYPRLMKFLTAIYLFGVASLFLYMMITKG